jgi:hypothetical protein
MPGVSCLETVNVISRKDAEARLVKLGVEKGGDHGPDCYGLREALRSALVVEEVADEVKPQVIEGVLSALVDARPKWLLVPKHTYFGERPWSEQQWNAEGLRPLRDEALEWGREDLRLVQKLVRTHFLDGWNVGWDLYLCSSDGALVGFVGHHDWLDVTSYDPLLIGKVSKSLAQTGIPHEIYPEADS